MVEDREELRRLALNQQDQATNQMRLRAEFEAMLKTFEPIVANFYRFVMDPEKGTIVRAGHLEDRMEAVEQHVQRLSMPVAGFGTLRDRVSQIEHDREEEAVERAQRLKEAETEKKDRKRWAWRDVAVPAIVSILVAILTAALILGLRLQ